MKRMALTLSITVLLLLACNLFGSVTITPAADLPVNTEVPVSTNVPVNTELPVNTEVPGLGSTRISETDGMTLVFVPGGDFTMGSDSSIYASERPVHTVFLDPYWIDQTEVTNAMFETFITQTGYQTDAEKIGSSYVFNPGSRKSMQGADWRHPQGPDSSLTNLSEHPVVHVSWNDAQAYCEWAGRRLPTEAEWEKAARGTDARVYPWGNQPPAGNLLNLGDASLAEIVDPAVVPAGVNWPDRSIDDGYQFTAPVGSFPAGASPYGALDMAGNVWEWVNDWAGEAYYQSSPSSNPGGPDSGEYRVMRGGSWYDDKDGQRAAYRGWAGPEDTDITLGFRCGLTP